MYKPTQSELNAFIRDKNGFGSQCTKTPKAKPTRGVLMYVLGSYKEVVLYDKPFNMLQAKKSNMIKAGYKKENLIINGL